MKLRLPLNRCIGTGLTSLAAGLTREAAEALAGMADDPVEAVHRARVALKRARSALRLLEKAGAAWAIMPRYRLTELGGRMSAAREAAVAAALAGKLTRRLTGRQREVARLLAARAGRFVPPDGEQIRQALLEESAALGSAPMPAVSPAHLRQLLRRSLDRADRRHQAAMRHPALESLHEWRKAVIILRDHTAFAASRWPLGAGAAYPVLVRLARQLGGNGDLALLGRRLPQLRVPRALAVARRRLVARLEEQRRMAALSALIRWLKLEGRLTRLLAEPKV
ncbi:MAG: CHAD domain-containing protein [Lacunisphaera sp.]|nr:CHAD domain-containing protein [Lacunisphaera sp.]